MAKVSPDPSVHSDYKKDNPVAEHNMQFLDKNETISWNCSPTNQGDVWLATHDDDNRMVRGTISALAQWWTTAPRGVAVLMSTKTQG